MSNKYKTVSLLMTNENFMLAIFLLSYVDFSFNVFRNCIHAYLAIHLHVILVRPSPKSVFCTSALPIVEYD